MNDACKRGHPFDEENTIWRTNQRGKQERRCRACKRLAMSRPDSGLGSIARTFLPVAPLVALAPRAAHDELGYERNGIKSVLTLSQQRKYHRVRAEGRISLAAADELSTAFGYHPAEVWGNDWWTA